MSVCLTVWPSTVGPDHQKQLRWDKTIANDILVVLDNLQLVSGLVQPVFASPGVSIAYAEQGLLKAIRERMHEIEATMWIEHAWQPKLQRYGDASMMELFLQIAGITTKQLEKLNAVRLYLQVITISDLVDPTGAYIPAGALQGEWQAGSDLLWPDQPSPAKVWWALFRKCLRMTVCRRAPVNQPAH